MSNEKIEKMLYDAQEKLPTTSLEWRVLDMAEKRVQKKKFYINKAVAACVAFVMFLGVGGVTVLANMEINIDPGNYSQWVDIRSEMDWDDYEQFMVKRGFLLPENFADLKNCNNKDRSKN